MKASGLRVAYARSPCAFASNRSQPACGNHPARGKAAGLSRAIALRASRIVSAVQLNNSRLSRSDGTEDRGYGWPGQARVTPRLAWP